VSMRHIVGEALRAPIRPVAVVDSAMTAGHVTQTAGHHRQPARDDLVVCFQRLARVSGKNVEVVPQPHRGGLGGAILIPHRVGCGPVERAAVGTAKEEIDGVQIVRVSGRLLPPALPPVEVVVPLQIRNGIETGIPLRAQRPNVAKAGLPIVLKRLLAPGPEWSSTRHFLRRAAGNRC